MDMTSLARPRAESARPDSAARDYPMLVALLNAAQNGNAAFFFPSADLEAAAEGDAFIELIAGGPSWRKAVLGQGGSFNREIAKREIDAGPPV